MIAYVRVHKTLVPFLNLAWNQYVATGISIQMVVTKIEIFEIAQATQLNRKRAHQIIVRKIEVLQLAQVTQLGGERARQIVIGKIEIL